MLQHNVHNASAAHAGMGNVQYSIDARNYSSLAALLVLLLDHLWLCKAEFRLIWKSPFRLSQGLYIISRYVPLVVQIVHYSFVQTQLVNGPVSTTHCRAWFSLLAGACTVLVITMDIILLLRIYALYMKNYKTFFLAVPLLAEHISALVLMGRHVFRDSQFSGQCDLHRTPIEAVPLGTLTVACHAMLWFAIFSKRNLSQAAVLSLVVRESHWSLAVFCITTIIMIPYSFHTHVVNPFIIFVWPITLISITSCRIVLNMLQLKTESSGTNTISTTDFLFSTILDSSRNPHEFSSAHTSAVEFASSAGEK